MKATRKVRVGDVTFGGSQLAVIAGPCAIESRELLERAATAVKSSGAHLLRGGAHKPRTSPRTFQGLGEEGVELLAEVGRRHALPIVSEVMDASQIAQMAERVDLLQVGARNMQNFSLLKELARARRPVLLKRGFAATVDEWLRAADYLLDGGNESVILCERGIRTFGAEMRFTLDLAAVAYARTRSDLPIIVDPSHATGIRELVTPMALAAVAAGADGIMVEVHPLPEQALCDGAQALTPSGFESLMQKLQPVALAVGRTVSFTPRAVAAVPALLEAR
ncbi:MAG: 3-deoxy-7-phosphoheptulonate synthase [Myxococcaceae bacterium]|nr:3-deoxy-7-phosphoheptulonate synthase [Myxococcaceae bacterium]